MNKTKKYTDKELAEAHVFPGRLSAAGKKKAINEFSDFRRQQIRNMAEKQRLYSKILQLKYIMQDYVNSEKFDHSCTFSHFLKTYLHSVNISKTAFSSDINLHLSQLSRLLNDKEEPSEKIAIRLELHSNRLIPAYYWLRISEKQREWELMNNAKIRLEEAKHVRSRVALV